MLITFEGIDGCGKSTQLKLLGNMLEEKGYKVHRLREPGGTELSEAIRKILLSSKSKINDIAELLLFESARANLVEEIIKPALLNNEFVLCDRFYDSTTAYQGYGRNIELEIIQTCNRIAANGVKPDLTFYLKVSIETSHRRSKHKEYDRIENAGDDFFRRVLDGFEQIAMTEPNRVIIIDAEGQINETKNKILSHIPIFNDKN